MRFPAPLRSFLARTHRALAVAALALPVSGALWQLDGPQSTFDVKGPVAQRQLDLFMVTFWVTLFLFIVVGGLLAYATLKFRAKNEAEEKAAPPPQGHGNPLVELAVTIGSILCLVIIAVPTMKAIWYTDDVPLDQKGDAYSITATGYQWWFKFEYQNEKIKLPGGGEGLLTTGNELVIPVGRPVHIDLRTADVIHSFWVPKLAGKVDMMPNRPNRLWLQADEAGYYYGQCAQYCGEDHALMRFRVIALNAPDFALWLENQKLPARAVAPMARAPAPAASPLPVVMAVLDLTGRPAREALSGMNKANTRALGLDEWKAKQLTDPAQEDPALIAEGRRLFRARTCIVCHTIRGHEGVGINAPDLTHVGARTTIAAGVLENTPSRMRDWITNPDHWKPGDKMFHGISVGDRITMPGYMKPDGDGHLVPDASGEIPRNIALTTGEISALTAYLQSLK